MHQGGNTCSRRISPPLPVQDGLITYLSCCNGPHCWAGLDPSAGGLHACIMSAEGVDQGGRVPLVSRARRSLWCRSCLASLAARSRPLLSFCLFLLCALPLRLTGHVEQRLGATQSDKTFPSALAPMLRATACLPSTCRLSRCRRYLSRASGLGISSPCPGTRVRGPYNGPLWISKKKKNIPGRLPPFLEPSEAQLFGQSQHHAINLSSSRHETRCGLTRSLLLLQSSILRCILGCIFCPFSACPPAPVMYCCSTFQPRLARARRDGTQPHDVK